jgi:hypothetical protein
MCVHVFECVHVYECVHVCECVHVYECVYICMYMTVCMYMNVYVCMYVLVSRISQIYCAHCSQIFVMTLHSVSEGIGIGVSFGGKSGTQLGQFISLSLGIHNIPEGLAVALVMRSRGFTKLRTIIWYALTHSLTHSLPLDMTSRPPLSVALYRTY